MPSAICTLWDFGIRQNYTTYGDRNFETAGTVQYKAGVNNLDFNGTEYNIGQALPFDVGGVSYSSNAMALLQFYWNQNFLLPTA
jgi:hypothetical protein